MITKLKDHLSMGKKGTLGSGSMGAGDKIIGAVVTILIVLSLLGATTGLLFTNLTNFTTALTANDTSGIGSAFATILPILLVVSLVALPIGVLALLRGRK